MNILFTDLDDTLFQTRRKLPPGTPTHLGAWNRQGEALSFFTPAQLSLLRLFADSNTQIIPVTGRNTDALNRINYRFHSFKIVSHGALILDEHDRILPDWLDQIDQELKAARPILKQAEQQAAHWIQANHLPARCRIIQDQSHMVYVSIKGEPNALDQIQSQMDTPLNQHRNDRNLALLPAYANKRRAVLFLMQYLAIQPEDLIIAAGDSLSDWPFMQLAQFSLIPNQSQIARCLI